METTSISTDEIVKKIMEDELGVLLLMEDNVLNPIRIMTQGFSYENKCGFYSVKTQKSVSVHIYPVYYHNLQDDECKYVKTRMEAVKELFFRWSAAGYNKRRAKNPFGCQAFQEYLNQIDYHSADYIIMTARE